jgi:hypothetical protein
MFPFGKGRPKRPRPTIETTPRIASPPHRGVAREAVRVVVDGVEQTLEIVRQERIHGTEAYWRCPGPCGELRWHLYLLNGVVACRECLGLIYSSDRTRNRAARRARRLRRKLGGLPSPLAPLPPRPKYQRRDLYAQTIAQIIAAEGVLAARLGAMVGRRRKRA